MWTRSFIGVAVGLLLSAGTALGHHAFSAEFDMNKPVTLNGTVTKVEWTNPHAFVYLDVADQSRNNPNWRVELGSRDDLAKQGWTEGSLKVGEKVTVQGWQAKDGSRFANADTITSPAGTKLSGASSYYTTGARARNTSEPRTTGTTGDLPQTASPLSLIALLGGVSLMAGLGLRLARR